MLKNTYVGQRNRGTQEEWCSRISMLLNRIEVLGNTHTAQRNKGAWEDGCLGISILLSETEMLRRNGAREHSYYSMDRGAREEWCFEDSEYHQVKICVFRMASEIFIVFFFI